MSPRDVLAAAGDGEVATERWLQAPALTHRSRGVLLLPSTHCDSKGARFNLKEGPAEVFLKKRVFRLIQVQSVCIVRVHPARAL